MAQGGLRIPGKATRSRHGLPRGKIEVCITVAPLTGRNTWTKQFGRDFAARRPRESDTRRNSAATRLRWLRVVRCIDALIWLVASRDCRDRAGYDTSKTVSRLKGCFPRAGPVVLGHSSAKTERHY